ncbi:MAG TPA: ATP-binding protein [Gammaproteobacteria bacterium]|nr:ATP-binding protein [Gammaproteobacteria bacterium]
MTFCSRPSRLALLRSVVRDAAGMVGLDDDASDAVVLAVNEACMNIIQHAYGMDPDGRIDLTLIQDADALVVQLRDYAAPVDVSQVRSRDLDDVRPGGLGVHMMQSLMDECEFMEPPPEGGNLLQMKKLLNSED